MFLEDKNRRLSIARALVRKPEIYVFDDSFSALDFKTDAKLRAALKNETKEATVTNCCTKSIPQLWMQIEL